MLLLLLRPVASSLPLCGLAASLETSATAGQLFVPPSPFHCNHAVKSKWNTQKSRALLDIYQITVSREDTKVE